jgi:hypothetical protein
VRNSDVTRATAVILRLAEMDLSEEQIFGLIGRLMRVPGAAQELDAALTEIRSTDRGSGVTRPHCQDGPS